MSLLRTFLLAFSASVSATSSSKRGLTFVSSKYTQDYSVWVQTSSDLTWYYNYGPSPSDVYYGLSQEEFEFVPMLWGTTTGTTFLDEIADLIQSGRNITHVLGFNEPDGSSATGGSNLTPSAAAKLWVSNIEPLASQGVKLGLPACTGGDDGIPWLKQFLSNCSDLVSTSSETKNCTYDFVNIHWYGDFDSMAGHLAEYSAA
jgi:hypothetical protein